MVPNYDIKADRCDKELDKDWTVNRHGKWTTDEEVQEIINRADERGYDAFVMNYNHMDSDNFGKVWFLKNCGENLIGESDLEYHSNGNRYSFIRKTKTCDESLAYIPQIQYEPEDEEFSYNIGDGL